MHYDPLPAETRRAIGRSMPDKRSVRHLLKAARAAKPAVSGKHYDEHQREVRLLYEGKQDSVLAAHLERIYPRTWRKMNRLGLNLLRLSADIDATVYDRPAQRWLTMHGERLDAHAIEGDDETEGREADPRARAFESMLKEARASMVMIEAERRVNATGSLPIRVGWDPKAGRVELSPRWPCDFHVVPYPLKKGALSHAIATFLRISSAGAQTPGKGTADVCEMFIRSATPGGPDGVVFGDWRRWYVTSDGDVYEPPDEVGSEWPGSHPVVMWHQGIPEGPFLDRDRDAVSSTLSVSESLTNLFYTLQMQAHDETVLKSKSPKARLLVTGPGAFNQIAPDETLDSVTRSPKVREYLETIDAYVRMFAKTRRQSEDAYSKEQTVPPTGVSRKIKERHYEKASRERELFAQTFEEDALLGRMIEESDRYGGTSIAGPGVRAHMRPAEPVEYEDPLQRDQRIDNAVDRGEITPERGAVEKELYVDEAEARAVMQTLEAGKPAPPAMPSIGVALGGGEGEQDEPESAEA